ncbi:hypothetical protein DEO72_LG5g2102 [Vigna unguiculata]|uniref:Uncharacterized protein n=1 Tax=Vigna unguiculata TaxID=3917 RepID=A0A4D6M1V8_VIGUN|nr:hypothetical protein DEO72_LG5g2102 [Vigna unguiculata]
MGTSNQSSLAYLFDRGIGAGALSGMGRVRGNGVIIFVKNSMENWVSGIFPETAWRVARERQATHAPDLVSGYQR